MNIALEFVDSISEASQEKLQTFLDNILAQGLTENRPPIIRFPGMREETYNDIRMLQLHYDGCYDALFGTPPRRKLTNN